MQSPNGISAALSLLERHKNKGIHFHLAVVCKEDIRGQIDFAACFPAERSAEWQTNAPTGLFKLQSGNKRRVGLLAADRETVRLRLALNLQPMRRERASLGPLPRQVFEQGLGQPIARGQRRKVRALLRPLSQIIPRDNGEQRKEKPPNKGRFKAG